MYTTTYIVSQISIPPPTLTLMVLPILVPSRSPRHFFFSYKAHLKQNKTNSKTRKNMYLSYQKILLAQGSNHCSPPAPLTTLSRLP